MKMSVSGLICGMILFCGIFYTQPLPMFDLAVCLVLSSLVLFAVEIEKWLVRRGMIYSND